tara:strand:- start:391 stop:843 length:453 start_codon:yes stop_codon:yes gene_type:complete
MDIEQCKADIKRHEGEVLKIYEDSLGYKTLGVGHLCQKGEPEYVLDIGTPVPQEVVDMYFEHDFEKHLEEAVKVFGSEDGFYNLPEDIQHVLVNMCFNLGGNRLSNFKNMLEACREHDWERMAAEMEDSKWFKQVGRRSLELQTTVLNNV